MQLKRITIPTACVLAGLVYIMFLYMENVIAVAGELPRVIFPPAGAGHGEFLAAPHFYLAADTLAICHLAGSIAGCFTLHTEVVCVRRNVQSQLACERHVLENHWR